MSELTEWNSFYVIVGSSAGALIGLQFVVLSSLPKGRHYARRRLAPPFRRRASFISGVVLLLSAIVSAPWHAIGAVAVFWGLVGLSG